MAKMGAAEAWGVGWEVTRAREPTNSRVGGGLGGDQVIECSQIECQHVTYFGEDSEFNAMNRVYMPQVPTFLMLSCFIPAGFTHSTHHLALSLTLSLLPHYPRGV